MGCLDLLERRSGSVTETSGMGDDLLKQSLSAFSVRELREIGVSYERHLEQRSVHIFATAPHVTPGYVAWLLPWGAIASRHQKRWAWLTIIRAC